MIKIVNYFFTLIFILLADISYSDELVKNHVQGECRTTIEQFLTKQLSPWKEAGILEENLNNVSKLPTDVLESFQLNRIQFIDGEFYGDIHASWGSAWSWLTLIKEAHKKNPIKNFDAIFACGDALGAHLVEKYNDILQKTPVFHINKKIVDNKYDKNVILLPGDYIMTAPLQKIYEELDQNQIQWQERKKLIGWRGIPSDGKYRNKNFSKLRRLKLVLLSSLYPDYIDAKFVKPKKSPIIKALSQLDISTDEFTPPKDMLKYRYLISLDGSASTFTRVPWVMYSNSTMLFQTEWVQWFFPAMKPFVHYVPLKDDLSDLLEKYQWLAAHDNEARIIATNARKFVTECISKEDSLHDLSLVLNEYASAQKFNLTKPTLKKLKDNEFSIELHNNSLYGQLRFRFWTILRKVQSLFQKLK